MLSLSVSDLSGKEISTGTGFLVSKDGKLVTNRHVIEKGSRVIARAEDGRRFEAKRLLAEDSQEDLALLKLDGKDLPALQLSAEDSIEPGSRITVIGSPLGLDGTISEGIVSARRELFGREMIQISAAISPGSSGSPVLNERGDVVGVASGQFFGDAQALNFAIPVGAVKALLAKGDSPGVALKQRQSKPANGSEAWLDSNFRACATAYADGEYTEALKRIRPMMQRYPNTASIYLSAGIIYGQLELYHEAVAAFQKAIELDSNGRDARYYLGWALFQLQNYDEARETYQKLVTLSPDFADGWLCLGLVFKAQGNAPEAASAFRHAVGLRSDYFEAWQRLGQVLAGQKQYEEAVDAYQHALASRSGHSDWSARWPSNLVPMDRSGRADRTP